MSLSLSNSAVYKPAPSASSSSSAADTGSAANGNNGGGSTNSNDNSANKPGPAPARSGELDFIASDKAVKELFSLPYATTGSISVAVHNLDGTLLIDNEVDFHDENEVVHPPPNLQQSSSGVKPTLTASRSVDNDDENDPSKNLSLVPTSTIMDPETGALAVLKSLVMAPSSSSSSPPSRTNTADTITTTRTTTTGSSSDKERTDQSSSSTSSSPSLQQQLSLVDVRPPVVRSNNNNNDDDEENKALGLPLPEDYIQSYVPRTIDPREYLSWRCREMNLLVGSNALVYRSPTGEAALTLRIEDVKELNSLLEQHQEAIRRGKFLPDHQLAALQQQGKPSYAEAAQKRLQIGPGTKNTSPNDTTTTAQKRTTDQAVGFAAPDLDQVRLQTCIVPSTPLGGMLDPNVSKRTTAGGTTAAEAKALSPVSTVVDAYLDNIMANVPQLALCLQEKGFVQSVKLLQTADIPSSILRSSTLDTSRPFDIISPDTNAEKVFSPQIMEMNASALLRFLKTNCTRNNTTYLLRREAGDANVQLYDISSVSAQKQRKWIWWLAMMSYRFANRLRDIANRTLEAQLARSCRNRQRSLLENSLELLEILSDMDGNARESLVAAIREHLADTFLWEEIDVTETQNGQSQNGQSQNGQSQATSPISTPNPPIPPTTFSQRQPYQKISVDALEKAQRHLERGVKQLWPVLQQNLDRQQRRKERRKRSHGSNVKVTTETEGTSSDSEGEERADDRLSQNEAVVTQLFGLHVKLVNLCLRLAEIHLKNYFSSSAMQCLRSAARRLADSLFLVGEATGPNEENKRTQAWLWRSQVQYVWLWEHCGHFARSFGSDRLWRERGHAAADDVLSVLRDAEAAFTNNQRLLDLSRNNEMYKFLDPDLLVTETDGEVSLFCLSGIVSGSTKLKEMVVAHMSDECLQEARDYLASQHLLRREERQVFVASCLAYQRAISAFEFLLNEKTVDATADLIGQLQQRLGDACNEVGKHILSALRAFLGAETDSSKLAAGPLLCSSFFWFEKGLHSFENCADLRNLALLRCNLCQCHKLRANAIFAKNSSQAAVHAEKCLQDGANHLVAAHEALGMREKDPACWDMVSGELAATYLVLGVRRRQSLIGSGNVPLISEALRLSPGKERSIIQPMERAMEIYQEMGNSHQAAATHYQLALYYSKIWTCQRDETKTREKLGSAFAHYSHAHRYFSQSLQGNESTFCLLCLDLSSLYASVQGEGGVSKALLCCFDTAPAFAPETVEAHKNNPKEKMWLEQMATLASEVEDRIFKLLRSLTKLEEDEGKIATPKYKVIYRAGLTAKMSANSSTSQSEGNAMASRISSWHTVLEAIRNSWHEVSK